FSADDLTPAVQRVLAGQQDAWNRRDLEAFMSAYWNSLQLTFFSGAKKTLGWQSTLDRYRQTYQVTGQQIGKLEFSELDINPPCRYAAFVCGAWKLTMSDVKTPHGVFTLIFRKFPDGWKIVHDHTSAAH